MAQIVNYVGIRDALINILKAANTTTATYDLSNSLTTRIKDVTKLDLAIDPVAFTQYPIVSVRLDSKEEEHSDFGSGKTDRMVTLNTQIFCVCDSGNVSTAEDSLWTMVRNIEVNLRSNIDLGGYNTSGAQVIDIIPSNVIFKEIFNSDDSAYNKAARIDTKIHLHVSDV